MSEMSRKEYIERDEDFEEEDSKEINLLGMAKELWARKRTVGKWCGIGAIVGLIIAFSIPKEYTTTVTLAPEYNDLKSNPGSGALGAMAAIAGIGGSNNGGDAVFPSLYPDVLESVPFNVALFDVPVTDKKKERHLTVREFLEEETDMPWWGYIMKLSGEILGAILPSDDDESEEDGINPFKLTKDETDLVEELNDRISGTVDQKTNVVTISVTMQDPMVSAILADTVVNRLREYITDYRTNKARQDMEYMEQLNEEAKAAYYTAQQKFADYLDSHQGMVLYSVRTTRDRLENEASLAFNMYNQTSHRLQMAKAKVQEVTPVYATIQPATVPIKHSAPRKVLILLGCIFLSFIACCVWILYIQPMIKEMKEKDAEKKQELKIEN